MAEPDGVEVAPPPKPARPLRVLVTGFGDFGFDGPNPTATIARAMAGKRDGIEWFALGPVPVVYAEAASQVIAEADARRADVVVVLGFAPGEDWIRIESFAQNASSGVLDNHGVAPDGPAVRGGPAVLPSTLDPLAMRNAFVERRREAYVSIDSGGFVCNDVFYRMLYSSATSAVTREVGLVHFGERNASDPQLPKDLERAIVAALREKVIAPVEA
jgi:pyroglutamyl-peptidase